MKIINLFIILSMILLSCGGVSNNSTSSYKDGKNNLMKQIKSATYKGFNVGQKEINLVDGRWEGSPSIKGSSSKPSVFLLDNFHLMGDLDGDDNDEIIVFLGENKGGSGEFIYMAVLKERENGLINISTKVLGDRIQIKNAIIENQKIILEIVRPGQNDAACCPGELIKQTWQLKSDELTKVSSDDKPKRLSLADIGESQWVLKSWNFNEAAPAEPEITLLLKDGKFTGGSGCNRYFTPVTPGDIPGAISIGLAGSTMMACPDSVMKIEQRFLSLLSGINRFGFINTKLALTYQVENSGGVLIFEQPNK